MVPVEMDQLGPVIRINLFTIYCSINAFYYMYIYTQDKKNLTPIADKKSAAIYYIFPREKNGQCAYSDTFKKNLLVDLTALGGLMFHLTHLSNICCMS